MRKLCVRFDAADLKITITQNTHTYAAYSPLGSPAAGPRLARARPENAHHVYARIRRRVARERVAMLALRTRETTGGGRAIFRGQSEKQTRARAPPSSLTFRASCPRPRPPSPKSISRASTPGRPDNNNYNSRAFRNHVVLENPVVFRNANP